MARLLFLQKIWTENLGPMYLSSYVKQFGHETGLIIESRKNDQREIRRFNPDIIAFSATTGIHHWALEKAAAIRAELDIPIILGGPHATYFPEVIQHPAIDVICRGEGEYAILEILNRLDRRDPIDDIPNLWVKTSDGVRRNDLGPLIENLDELPPPDRDLYYRYAYLRNNENKSFISGRGCPYSCKYCSIASLRDLYAGKGPFVRFHSPERVVTEITDVQARYGLRSVIFQDDTFIVGTNRLKTLLEQYSRDVQLPFVCHIRADLVTPEISTLLKRSGCHSVDFGLESGDETLREDVLGKPITDDQIRYAARVLRESGIRFRTTNMMGLPGETLDQAFMTVCLNQEIRTDYPSASVYQPYPRTELGDRVIREGLVSASYSVDDIGSTFLRSSVLQMAERDQFINLQKLFWPAVKWPWSVPVIKRLIRCRPNPLFELVFLFFYAVNYSLSEKVTIKRVLNLGWHTVKNVFFGKL